MNFTIDTFLRPLTANETKLRIYTPSGILFNAVDPLSIIRTYVSNNLVKINLNKSQILTLSFSSNDEARAALEKSQAQIDILKQKPPLVVDKKIEQSIIALREVTDRIIATGPSNVISITSSITSDKIETVSINGVVVYDWTLLTGSLTINNLPYSLDIEDLIIVEYKKPV